MAAAPVRGAPRGPERGDAVSAVKRDSVRVNGRDCRTLAKGDGEPLGYLAGLIGLPKWTPLLDRLEQIYL